MLMVNAYKVYCRVYEVAGATPLSHYKFHKDCVLAWMDSDRYGGESLDGDVDNELSTLSTKTGESSGGTPRKKRFNDSALHPEKGYYRERLNRNVAHWPSTPPQHNKTTLAYCQLHKWACGLQMKKNIAYCEECNVTLCIDCYAVFHTTYDLAGEKEPLRQEMNARSEKK